MHTERKMPVKCTHCGGPIEEGQRFCAYCGTPVVSYDPEPENKPNIDLSPYFDEKPEQPAAKVPAPAPREEKPAPAPKAARPAAAAGVGKPASARPAEKAARPGQQPAKARKGEKALNIALMICAILAIGVITFLLILLLGGRDGDAGNGGQQTGVPVTREPQSLVTEPPETEGPAVIITPAPETSALPVTPVSPTPTTAPTASPAQDYLLPESNSRFLTEADLSGLSHEQLCFARNEIFARHGRIFQTPQIASYFSSKSWYRGTVPGDKFDESVLNQYEWTNINFIRDYESRVYGGSYY